MWINDCFNSSYVTLEFDDIAHSLHVVECGGGSSDKNGMYLLLTSLQILKPMEICTQTFLVGNSMDTYDEAYNCMNYLKCKFTRFLILQSMTSQDLSPERFRFVPLQDFTKPWTDEELYKKYNLTNEEIQFIESMIKPME